MDQVINLKDSEPQSKDLEKIKKLCKDTGAKLKEQMIKNTNLVISIFHLRLFIEWKLENQLI